MARPEFSEMLIQRRRDLGLTTAQASRVLKLKEQVLISLEEGDFESIPKSGYAQGMVSSYARYLGLDSREVVDTFIRDLDAYEKQTSKRGPRKPHARSSQRGILSTQRQTVDDSRRQLLPTSGGRAGDMGDFATTSPAQTRTNSVQLVSSARMRSQGLYERSYDTYDDDYELTSAPVANPRRVRTQVSGDLARPKRSQRGSQRLVRGMYSNERISRSQYSDEYEDDRVAGEAMSFEPAASPAGRRSSHRIPKAKRPGNPATQRRDSNGRGRSGSTQRRDISSSRNRSRSDSQAGLVGVWSFISESRAIIGIVALILVILLMVIIFMGVKSCTSSTSSGERVGIPVSTTVTSTTTGTVSETEQDINQIQQQESAQTTSVQGEQTTQETQQTITSENGDSQTAMPSGEVSTQEPINAEEGGMQKQNLGDVISTEVTVSVVSSESTWLEIMQDGQSMIADQVLGPWSETYDVKESITISADNTAAVSVFENGTSRSFENRVSGVGSITIKVPVSNTDTMNTLDTGTSDVVDTTTSNR